MGPRICANFKSVFLLSFCEEEEEEGEEGEEGEEEEEEEEEEVTRPATPLAQGSSCWPRRRLCVLHSLEEGLGVGLGVSRRKYRTHGARRVSLVLLTGWGGWVGGCGVGGCGSPPPSFES